MKGVFFFFGNTLKSIVEVSKRSLIKGWVNKPLKAHRKEPETTGKTRSDKIAHP